MTILTRPRKSGGYRPTADIMDDSLYDAFLSKFASYDLEAMVRELRTWSPGTPISRSMAAMVRLLDLAIMSETLTRLGRRRAARLAVVIELIVRSRLDRQAGPLATMDSAYALLLHFGESRTPCPDAIAWILRERQERGLPSIAAPVVPPRSGQSRGS